MPDPFDKISDDFEKKLAREQAATLKAIREAYEQAIVELTLRAATLTIKGQTFNLSKYPTLNKLVEEVMKDLHGSIYATVVNGIEAGWKLSNEKNNILVDRRLAGKQPVSAVARVLYDPNKGALDAFLKRKEKGLNLSDRVWKTLDNYKTEMEGALGLGISEGKSAQKMAGELKSYLVDNDKLFRRVRNHKGQLKLSKAAREFKPGQGKYRSSHANAVRLARTENQMAYQNADFIRYQKIPFIKGIDVRLSRRHVTYDVCDETKGLHPPDYKFIIRHPNCLCHSVPVLMSDEEYDRYEDAILAGEPMPEFRKIDKLPAAEIKWMKDNAERIKGWENTPIFINENEKYLKGYLK